MDLFQLMGTIAIEGAAQAQADVSAVGNAASTTAGQVQQLANTTQGSNSRAGSSWASLKSKVDEYKAQGLSTSKAWAQATADMREAAAGAETGITSAFKNIATVVGTALAVDKLVAFGQSCVDAASNVEEMENKFSVVFGELSGETSQWAEDYSKSIGRNKTDIKTWLADNQNMFVGMGMTREQGAKLSKNLVTLGLDLASFNNLSEPDAVNALSKAMMGETESAKRLGAVLNENTLAEAQAQLGYKGKFETLTEAQKMEVRYQAILNQSQDAIGDCERSMGSYKSTQTEANSAVAELTETIGGYLLPVATKLMGFYRDAVRQVTRIVKWFGEHKKVSAALAIGVGVLGAAILAYNVAMNAGAIATTIATTAATAFGSVMAFLTSPITLIVLGLAALAAGFYALYENCEPVRNAVDRFVQVVRDGAIKEFERLKPWIDAVVWAFQQLWNTLVTQVSAGFQWVVTAITDLYNSGAPIIEAFKTVFANSFEAIKTIAGAVFDSIKTIIRVALDIVFGIISTVTALIRGDWEGAWNAIKHMAQQVWEGIKTIISNAILIVKTYISVGLTNIQTIWAGIWATIGDKVTEIWNTIKTTVSNAISAMAATISILMTNIKTTIQNIWNNIKTNVTTTINNIKTTVENVWSNIKTTATNVWNGIKGAIATAWSGISSNVTQTINTVKSTVTSVFDSLKTTVTNTWNSIKSAIETPITTAKNTVHDMIEKIKGFFNFEWSLPKLKMPHVKISGGFSLMPPSAPSFSVEWYKKAMDNPLLFTEPTIFGFNPTTGMPRGAGEAGDEVMIGKDTMLNMIQTAVAAENAQLTDKMQRIVDLLQQFFPDALRAMNQQIVLDTGVLVAQTAPAFDAELGRISIKKGRGR